MRANQRSEGDVWRKLRANRSKYEIIFFLTGLGRPTRPYRSACLKARASVSYPLRPGHHATTHHRGPTKSCTRAWLQPWGEAVRQKRSLRPGGETLRLERRLLRSAQTIVRLQ